MTGLIQILLLGTLVLVLAGRLLVQWTKKDHARVSVEDYSSARAAIDSVFVEIAAIQRIFAPDDMEFIASFGSASVRQFFLKERKKLAIQWLRMTQKQVRRLMDLHLKLASYTSEPSPRFEVKLAVNYLGFIVASNAVLILFWLGGPFRAVRIVGYTVRVANDFCAVFSQRLENVNPIELGSARQPRLV
ncbi:MAG: hypothetical protein WCE61_14730 [Candidatus Acidiferrum sp.]